MLKGKILKNLFVLESAKCASFATAESLVRKLMPKGTYRDDNVMVVPVGKLGTIELAIIKEKGFYRIHVACFFGYEWDA